MENEEFRLLMKARQNVYDLLRCFFLQEPAEDFLNALKDENILKDLSGYNKDLDEGVELVSSALSSPTYPDWPPFFKKNSPVFS